MTDLAQIHELVTKLNGAVSPLREQQETLQAEVKRFGEADAVTKDTIGRIETDISKITADMLEIKRAGALGQQHKTDEQSEQKMLQKSAIGKILRGKHVNDAEEKALSTLANPDGGYFAPPDMSGEVIAKVRDMSPMRAYARVEGTGRSEKKGKLNNGRNAATWGFEKQTPSKTATKQWGQWSVDIKKLYAYFSATEEILEDAEIDIQAEMVRDVVMAFAEQEGYGFLLGDGNLQPVGLMTAATAYTGDNTRAWGTVQKFKTGVNGGFAVAPNGGDILIDAFTSLRTAYRRNAIFGCNRFTFGNLMKLKDSDGAYIWKPTWGMQDSPFGRILGVPVVPDFDHMADIANDSLSMFVGDLDQAYKIVDRRGIIIKRDDITDPSESTWYVNKRTGGGLVNSEAVRFIEFKA